MGRRVEKVAGGVTTAWTYDGEDILREASGATTLKYVHGPGIDEPLATDDGSTLTHFQADGLGSVVKVTSSAGAVTMTRQYDAWGALQGGTSGGYAYTGREWEPETGLYYYRARYYDPNGGRFLSEDPIQFAAGVNFFTYVRDNPVGFNDPFGLEAGFEGQWQWKAMVPNRAGRPSPNCLDAFSYAVVLGSDVWNSRMPDKYAHCLAHCGISKGCGNLGQVFSFALGYGKEAADAAAGGITREMQCYVPSLRGRLGRFPRQKWDPDDVNANECGRTCPANQSCEARCLRKLP